MADPIKAFLEHQAATKAEQAQRRGIEAARGDLGTQYDISKGYFQPYYQTGTAASNRLAALLGVGPDTGAQGYGDLIRQFSMQDYQQDPGYQFRLQEGLKQLRRGAAARGGMLSGTTLAGTQKYAQGLASQEYGGAYDRYRQRQLDIYNMLAGQQGVGYRAASDLGNLSSEYGANLANLAMGKGNVEAKGVLGKYGAITNYLAQNEEEGKQAIGAMTGIPFGGGGGGSSRGSTYQV